ncbi:SUKH-4 family immunity protein [Streptomyces sp. V3I7]|uniref:SUKH-4 family immunity protein n=1 Tax=Streptomyces sp. V3I7 TaxID=3042278 RepID=UPI0027838C12|nr:SUKH-4 family immunity protein [Streptomyces sp. V3I7]MDQ0991180.1 hypothetical protein [Streptomyces sp. V3I7]
MRTRDAGAAAITLTDKGTGRRGARAARREAPAGLERTRGRRRFADVTDGPTRLAQELRNRLVFGELLAPVTWEAEAILLDGGTVEMGSRYHYRPVDPRSPAPSPATLLRFAAVTEELAGLRGRFASLSGRYGTEVAAEASRQLLALFEEGARTDDRAYGTAAALIRPLALAAGRGTDCGLALELPGRLLEQEFGRGGVPRFEDVDFPAALTHEPTRRFLRETGLPEDTLLFRMDTDVPLPTLVEHCAEEWAGAYPLDLLPAGADRLIRLGRLDADGSVLVDGSTGAVLHWSESKASLEPLHTDVSTLAFTLWLLHRERALDAYHQLAARMIQILSALDWHYWTELFRTTRRVCSELC